MAKYSIRFRRSAAKELKELPVKYIKPVLKKIESLAVEPRPSGCVKLAKSNHYRIRHGIYRIVYSVEDNVLTVIIIRIAHRKRAYR